MKKNLYTVFLAAVIFLSSNIYAQFKFSLGPRAGVNIANLSFDPDFPSGIDKSSRVGFKFGVLAELGFSPMFAIQVEPMYVMKGSELSEGNAKAKFKASFLEIPVVLKVKFNAGDITPYIFAGPNIGLLLSAKFEDEFNSQTVETDIKDETSSIDFAIDFGAGVGIAAGSGSVIIFDVRYALGLSNLNDNPDDPNTTIKSTGIQILVGAAFAIN